MQSQLKILSESLNCLSNKYDELLAINSKLNEEDFKFFFDSVKESVKDIFQTDKKPIVLVSESDASKAIPNAFTECFGDA